MQRVSSLPGGRRPVRRQGSTLYTVVAAITIMLGAALFYVYLFTGLQRVAHPDAPASLKNLSPLEAPRVLNEAAHAVADRIRGKCPTCKCAAEEGGAAAGGGGGGDRGPSSDNDPDAWLDRVGDDYPKIVPSHYAMVHGMEPYERPNQKVWDLHVIPTDEWYETAKKATDRCDLELHGKIQGAENGLEDKVVWVSALFDLKRGEAKMGEFQRGMDEYYRRFQIVLDRGFQMLIYIPQVRAAVAGRPPSPLSHSLALPRPLPPYALSNLTHTHTHTHTCTRTHRLPPQEFEPHLKIDYKRVKVVYMNMTDLHWYFPYWERVQQIRTSQLWVAQSEAAGWLKTAPQARLEGYNPLVMAKAMLLRDAARINPWGSRYHSASPLPPHPPL